MKRPAFTASFLVVVFCVYGTQAVAFPVTWEYAGEITFVRDDNNMLQGAVEVGSSFWGSFTFESTTPDSAPDDALRGAYTDPFLAVSGRIGTLEYSEIGGLRSTITMTNYPGGGQGGDGLRFFVGGVNVPGLQEFVGIVSGFADSTGTVLTSDQLLVVPPDLNAFDFTAFSFYPESELFSVVGEISFLVPEGDTLLFLALGVFLCARTRVK